MALTVTVPDPTDNPPIYLGVGHTITVHESTVFNIGDRVTATLSYVGTSALYPMAFGQHVAPASTGALSVTLGPVGFPARGAALGQALRLDLSVTAAGGFTPYDTVQITGVYVHDPISGAVSSDSLVAQVLAAVQHTFPTTA